MFFTLIPRLDLGVVVVVVTCCYFDIVTIFLCSTHHSLYWCKVLKTKFTTISIFFRSWGQQSVHHHFIW